MSRLSEAEIKASLADVPDWSELDGEIQRTYQFSDFDEAMRFVNRVAEQAESSQHHPDILIRYNKVTLSLSTHDAGGITSKDFELARQADLFAST
ncbi:MAG: 4a-hydroxytetrahydrobiopterin dehydratase [Phycisphaerales bacterium]|nr:4a-hydroxytetrahydrobiopterin dehydratase [Phycisphaerales bacterium]